MITEIQTGPLAAILRECWVLKSYRRHSCEQEGWTQEPTYHAIVVESVAVEELQRRQGHCKRFIEQLCQDQRFELVIVEAVQNKHLAEALLRWDWDCDPQVMDFYYLHPKETKT